MITEDNFKLAFESSPIGMAIVSSKGELIYLNESFSNLLGYSREELLGVTSKYFTHPDDYENGQEYLQKLLIGEIKEYQIEKRYIHKDGSIVFVILKASALNNSEDERTQFLGQIVDITSQKKGLSRMMLHEQLLNNINENIGEAIYRSIPGKGLAYVNNAFVRMFGWNSIEECLEISDEDVSKFFFKSSGRKLYLEEIYQNGHYENKEILFRRRDGSSFWGLDNSIVSRTPDGLRCIDGVIVDVTKKREAELLLRQTNNELVKINDELDRFVYSASHDLKAPLTSLHGLLNIAAMESSSEEMQQYLKLMEKSVVKLESFIKDIIHYSRNSRTQVEIKTIDIRELVYEIVEKLKYIENEKEIDFQLEIGTEVEFSSDPKRLRVILLNIISNAIAYCDPAKEKPYLKIRFTADKGLGKFEVSDNGIGIKDEYINKIFDMFYRASEGSNGSGLGLYIVKESVKKLKGTIEVESDFGVGTTFRLSFPNKIRASANRD